MSKGKSHRLIDVPTDIETKLCFGDPVVELEEENPTFGLQIKNESGIEPLEYNILVKPDDADDHSWTSPDGKKFQIHKPDEYKDREQVSATEGVVVAVSPTAFTFENGAPTAEVGDRVLFPRHNAMQVTGKDGKMYFMLKDKAIAGVYR